MNSQEQIISLLTQTTAAAGAAEPAARPRILVVDDETYVRTFIRMALERAGYAVTEAGDGRLGMQLYAALEPACVITDMRMPEKDGIEMVMEMRRCKHQARIVAISGGFDAYTPVCLQTAKQLGADATLHKPFSVEELLNVVGPLVARNAAADGR